MKQKRYLTDEEFEQGSDLRLIKLVIGVVIAVAILAYLVGPVAWLLLGIA